MSQEITIIIKIDIAAAIAANSLEGHVYLFDNLRTDGSQGIGSGYLTSMAQGFTWYPQGQAAELLLNWLPSGIAALPSSLPRSFHRDQARRPAGAAMAGGAASVPPLAQRRNGHGKLQPLKAPVLNLFGQPFTEDQAPTHLSYLTPILQNIRGAAVEQGVIFPAQYGTPIPVNDGWYWSASVNTQQVGTWNYTMDFILHKLVYQDGQPIWEPFELSCDSAICVRSMPKRNGFTGAGLGWLPI